MVTGSDFTIGVEEEFLLLDPNTRAPLPEADRILPLAREVLGDQVNSELQLAQLETSTGVCTTLADVRRELTHTRRRLAEVVGAAGAAMGAAGSHPFANWREDGRITPKEAYQQLERDYQQLAREQLICGCHVHIGIADREEVIQVMNRSRPWLSPILALAANSPYWAGSDTGYASYRTEIWRRWPMAETPEIFENRGEFDQLVQVLIATGSIDAPARLYWDVRPSARFATLEFRVTDICLSVDEAVMVAGLFRALACACSRQMAAGEPMPRPRGALLRAATWRAARFGLEEQLLDVPGERARPAAEVVGLLLTFLRPSLEDAGDWEEVSELTAATLSRGTGAVRQRRAFARGGRLEDVVDLIISETVP